MITYLKSHEIYMREILLKNDEHTDWQRVKTLHEQKLNNFQHERLIHLIVMLTTSLAALLSFFFTLLLDIPAFLILTLVLLILSIAYVIHYFKLENGVQRLYRLGDALEKRLN